MPGNGSGPPDKTSILDSAAYVGNPQGYNDAATALYRQGYVFGYNVPGTTWTLFQGYKS
jgi:hypothetical protein